METIGRKTVREGYAVLLTAQHLRELPEDCPRLCAFTARAGELLFRQALEDTSQRQIMRRVPGFASAGCR